MPVEITDSVTFDVPVAPHRTPWEVTVCREADAPVSEAERSQMTVGKIPYRSGIEPEERPTLPGYDSGIACLLLGVFLLLAFNLSRYSTYIKTFTQDLWSVRRRENVFNVRTINETRVQMSLLLLVCICEGILAHALTPATPLWGRLGMFPVVLILTSVAALYYLAQTVAYRLVGYVFSDRVTSRQWLKGFSASQSLLGLALTIPALLVLFNPGAAFIVVPIAVFLYFTARLIFISKGFRLFYHNFDSSIYFILYLCTLEIIPLILLVRAYGFIAYFQP